jgi:hypothetical protein
MMFDRSEYVILNNFKNYSDYFLDLNITAYKIAFTKILNGNFINLFYEEGVTYICLHKNKYNELVYKIKKDLNFNNLKSSEGILKALRKKVFSELFLIINSKLDVIDFNSLSEYLSYKYLLKMYIEYNYLNVYLNYIHNNKLIIPHKYFLNSNELNLIYLQNNFLLKSISFEGEYDLNYYYSITQEKISFNNLIDLFFTYIIISEEEDYLCWAKRK